MSSRRPSGERSCGGITGQEEESQRYKSRLWACVCGEEWGGERERCGRSREISGDVRESAYLHGERASLQEEVWAEGRGEADS